MPSATVYSHRISIADPGRPVIVCRAVDGSDGDDDGEDVRFANALVADPTVADADPIDETDGGGLYWIELCDPPVPIARKYVEVGTTPVGATVTVDG